MNIFLAKFIPLVLRRIYLFFYKNVIPSGFDSSTPNLESLKTRLSKIISTGFETRTPTVLLKKMFWNNTTHSENGDSTPKGWNIYRKVKRTISELRRSDIMNESTMFIDLTYSGIPGVRVSICLSDNLLQLLM